MTDTISIIPTKIPIVSASINPTQSSIERIWVSTRSRIAPETAASVLFTLFVIMAAIVTTKIMIAAI